MLFLYQGRYDEYMRRGLIVYYLCGKRKIFKNLHFLTKNGIFEKIPSRALILGDKKNFIFSQFCAKKICIFLTCVKIGS